MILVDTSVWIDYFNGKPSPPAGLLDSLLGRQEIVLGDLILAEVLQGFPSSRDFNRAHRLLSLLTFVELGGKDVAIQSARNYRHLRALGVTVRKTIDCIIATRCILSGYSLLHNDRDFDPFERHLNLRVIR